MSQHLDDFRANPIKHLNTLFDGCDINIQGCCNSLLRNSAFKRLEEHEMLSHRRDPIHALVICVTFVVGRQDAIRLANAEKFESFKSEMTIQQKKSFSLSGINNKGFDQAYFSNRRKNLLEDD